MKPIPLNQVARPIGASSLPRLANLDIFKKLIYVSIDKLELSNALVDLRRHFCKLPSINSYAISMLGIQGSGLQPVEKRHHFYAECEQVDIRTTTRITSKQLNGWVESVDVLATAPTQILARRFEAAEQIPSQEQRCLNILDTLAMLVNGCQLSLAPPLTCGDSYRNSNGQQATQCLDPARRVSRQPAVLNPVSHRAHQQPQSGTAQYETPNSPKSPLFHLFWHSNRLHLQQFSTPKLPLSLPASCHHVQQAAASRQTVFCGPPNKRYRVPGTLQMSLMKGTCDFGKRHRSVGTHTDCSRQRQAKYRHLWEAPNQGA